MTETTSVQSEVAASRRGDARARHALLERIERARLEDLAAVLTMLDQVDAPEVLQLIATVALDDERSTRAQGGERRICDLAVVALATRLKLSVPQPAGGPYTREQREAVRSAVRSSLPM